MDSNDELVCEDAWSGARAVQRHLRGWYALGSMGMVDIGTKNDRPCWPGSLVPGGGNSEMVHNAEHCRGADSGVGVAGLRGGGQQPSRACPHPGLGRCCRRNPVRCRADLFRGFVAGIHP